MKAIKLIAVALVLGASSVSAQAVQQGKTDTGKKATAAHKVAKAGTKAHATAAKADVKAATKTDVKVAKAAAMPAGHPAVAKATLPPGHPAVAPKADANAAKAGAATKP